MSLILEALRKSEAERRRGQTPDLLTDATPIAPAARDATPNRGLLAAVIGAAVLTLLLVVWWLRSPVPRDPEAANEPLATIDGASTASPATDQATPSQGSLSPPISRAPAKTASPTPATLQPPAPLPPPAQASTSTAPSVAIEPPPATSTERKPAPSPPPVQVASTESASAPPGTPAFASPETPLKLSDLSTEERQQLPALKVSMHMWAPDAGNRFAIIDGARVNEGDRVGEATIEAIQQDSVTLAWRGRHIRLPIR